MSLCTSSGRRTQLGKYWTALVAAVFLGWAGAVSAQPQQIRISTTANPADWSAKSLLLFKERVEASAPGQFNVQVFPNATLFRQGTEVPALQRGTLDMSTIATFEVDVQVPEYAVFSAGYVFRDYDHMKKVFAGEIGKAYASKVRGAMGIEILEPMLLGTRHITLREARPVRTPTDLRGVKLRMPGGPGWLVLGRALGASPAPVAMPEVYLALKTGTIDGQENPLGIAVANKIQEVSKQLVLTGHLVMPVFLSMSSMVWNKLSPENQAKFHAAAKAAAEFNDTNRLADEGKLIEMMKSQGIQITTPDLAAFQAAMKKAYLESDVSKSWQPGLYERVQAVR